MLLSNLPKHSCSLFASAALRSLAELLNDLARANGAARFQLDREVVAQRGEADAEDGGDFRPRRVRRNKGHDQITLALRWLKSTHCVQIPFF
jgi:hypothetical protein